MEKLNLLKLNRQELEDHIMSLGEKSFRASQLWSWIYQHGVASFDEMTNITKAFRQRLDAEATIGSIQLVQKSQSSTSGTQKYLWQLEDGLQVESVYIPEEKRRTACISTQVGCALGCQFCATGTMGFIRNLEPCEIVEQVLQVRRDVGQLTNLVIMGMGEPFNNYDNLLKALYTIKDGEGIAIGHRKITISTAGVVPQILRYTGEKHPFLLAISLNATTDTIRSQIMPINRKYPIEMVLDAAKKYTKTLKKRLTFEYVLIHGVNDSAQDAQRLIKLLKGIPCKINLIAYNTTTDALKRPSDEHVYRFAEWMRPIGAPVTLRLSRGQDIDGACGQLVVAGQKKESRI